MGSDGAGLNDNVQADLNPADEPEQTDQPQRLARPTDGAKRDKWLDYLVFLGADRAFLEGETKHYDPDADDYVSSTKLSREELRELADRLEG